MPNCPSVKDDIFFSEISRCSHVHPVADILNDVSITHKHRDVILANVKRSLANGDDTLTSCQR